MPSYTQTAAVLPAPQLQQPGSPLRVGILPSGGVLGEDDCVSFFLVLI